jgi:hypothetical protein
MTDREAMKLALFALDIVKIHYTQSRHINEAITALKERLAQPPQHPWVGLTDEEIDAVWVTVAWRSSKGLQELRREYARAIESAYGIKGSTWVGLTDEEKNDCLVSADPCETLAEPEAKQLIEDVEQALKEKNT